MAAVHDPLGAARGGTRGHATGARARDLPLVSIVLPVRNEAPHIEACLERLLEQDYPHDLVEILVVDGDSTDGLPCAIGRAQRRHPERRIKVFHNEARIVPPALNIGIRAARGAVVVRMDGHAVPAKDYVSSCVAVMQQTGAANVGGHVEPVGTTPFGRAVALATRHRLGAGDARYRIGGTRSEVDTVMFGAFHREAFFRVGLFDESMVRDQDYEFNVRLRKAGERIVFDPSIRFTYTPRSTPRGLWRQYFEYGWWKGETWRRHFSAFRWRQLLPPAFTGGLLALSLAATLSAMAAFALVAVLGVYLGTVAVVSRRLATGGQTAFGSVVLAFLVMHFAYGLGVLAWAASGGRFPYRARGAFVPRLGEADGRPEHG